MMDIIFFIGLNVHKVNSVLRLQSDESFEVVARMINSL